MSKFQKQTIKTDYISFNNNDINDMRQNTREKFNINKIKKISIYNNILIY